MPLLEVYLLLLTDTLTSNIIISVHEELILYTMLMFGSYNKLLILVIVVIASMFATSVNYFFGRILLNIFYYTKDQQKLVRHQLFVQFFQKYSHILLIFTVVHMWGKFILLVAGFTKINFSKVLGITTLAKICYYMYIIYFY